MIMYQQVPSFDIRTDNFTRKLALLKIRKVCLVSLFALKKPNVHSEGRLLFRVDQGDEIWEGNTAVCTRKL